MTVIAACKRDGVVVIGADSFVGSQYERLPGVIHKLVRLGNFIIGISGLSVQKEVLMDFRRSKCKFKIFDSRDCSRFVQKYFRATKQYVDSGVFKDKDDVTEDAWQVLIATKENIFFSDGNACIYEIPDCYAVGAGSKEARTAMLALLRNTQYDSRTIVEEAIQIACDTNPMCYPPIFTDVVA
jgi:ATP-dependent protease HslVU (ClpYQ) peptidase subunit